MHRARHTQCRLLAQDVLPRAAQPPVYLRAVPVICDGRAADKVAGSAASNERNGREIAAPSLQVSLKLPPLITGRVCFVLF